MEPQATDDKEDEDQTNKSTLQEFKQSGLTISPAQDLVNHLAKMQRNNPDDYKQLMEDYRYRTQPKFDSELEKRLHYILYQSRLLVMTQVQIGPYRADMVLKYQKHTYHDHNPRVIVEVDGKNFHHGLIDDFRDDHLHAISGLPIVHVRGSEAFHWTDLCALKIVDIFFPEARPDFEGRQRSRVDYLSLLYNVAYDLKQANLMMHRAGFLDFDDPDFFNDLNRRLEKPMPSRRDFDAGETEWRTTIIARVIRQFQVPAFTAEDFTEGWIHPWQSSGYSTKKKRDVLRQELGNPNLKPHEFAREYINYYYQGAKRDLLMRELNEFVSRRESFKLE